VLAVKRIPTLPRTVVEEMLPEIFGGIPFDLIIALELDISLAANSCD